MDIDLVKVDITKVLVEAFISETTSAFDELDNMLQNNPFTKEERIDILVKILKRGINFGIEKGIFVEQCRSKKISAANELSYTNWITGMVDSLNEPIELAQLKKKKKK